MKKNNIIQINVILLFKEKLTEKNILKPVTSLLQRWKILKNHKCQFYNNEWMQDSPALLSLIRFRWFTEM